MKDRFLKACRSEPVDRPPVWFMRQAGRYMAEYRALRAKNNILELIAQPELAAEVTLQPIKAFELDAAILFCDLLVVLDPMGAPFSFVKGEGPRIHDPIRTTDQISALRTFDPAEHLGHVLEAIRILRGELGDTPLIGFGGAPFTLASYLIEGQGSRTYAHTKELMFTNPKAWHELADKLAVVVRDFLLAQVEAGAQAIQIFDSWVGCIGPDDYRELILPHSQKVLAAVAKTGVPVLHFGTGCVGLLPTMAEAGGDVIGLDWRIRLDEGRKLLGDKAVQGNLDPVRLLGPRDRLTQAIHHILDQNAGRPGHIFNVGHGILPNTPVDSVKAAVEAVQAYTDGS